MNRRSLRLTAVTLFFITTSVSPLALAFDGAQYSNEAKVSLTQARHIALSTYPGKIVSEELEKEGGGSGLRYSFDIKKGNTTHEVGVDAKTGKVLENSVEGPNAD